MQLGVLAVLAFAPALSLDNGVGRTPALGWSSWNYVQDNVNQTFIHGIADALVSTGLRDAGYQYVNLDAGVWLPSRTNSTGELQPDPDKFPDGIKALADRLHSQGMKLGLYINLGPDTGTCGVVGSMGNYQKDAKTIAGFGADYLKVDYCDFNPATKKGEPWVPSIATQLASWQELRDALNETGRPIFYNACPRSFGGSLVAPDPVTKNCKCATGSGPDCPRQHCVTDCPPHEWSGETRQALANSVLTEYSNSKDMWTSAMSNLDAMLELRPAPDVRGPGYFTDGDMLHSCNFGGGAVSHDPGGMKLTEYQAQFALWALLASPMILSADLRSLQKAHPDCLAMLKNKDVLSVNQDSAANAPTVVFKNQTDAVTGEVFMAQAFSRVLGDGSVALAMLNREDHGSVSVEVSWEQIGLPAGASCAMRDLLAQTDLPKSIGSYSKEVNSHEVQFVQVTCN